MNYQKTLSSSELPRIHFMSGISERKGSWDLDVACPAKIFARSKFVLSTAGQTLYELAAMNKAFCSIVFTEHQKEDGLGFKKYGCN